MRRDQTVRRDLWPLKLFGAACAIFFGGADLTFPGDPTSPGILLFVGFLLIVDALNDREMQRVVQRWADEDRAAKEAADKAQAERDAAKMDSRLRDRQRDFRAGKDLGFHMACYASNRDLLKLETMSAELREKLERKQAELLARIDEISRRFRHLNVPDDDQPAGRN